MLIIGPGLIKIFNNEIGTQLYPIIMTGSLAALLVSPLLQFLFSKFASYDTLLRFCGFLILLSSCFNCLLEIPG